MLASALAPRLLIPVGHGVIELHRLLTDLQVQAFILSQPFTRLHRLGPKALRGAGPANSPSAYASYDVLVHQLAVP